MPDGPWGREQPLPPPPKDRRWRYALWACLILAAVGGVWALASVLPGQVTSNQDWAEVARLVGILALVSASVITASRDRLKQRARFAAIWVSIFALLVLGFAYRTDLMGVVNRVVAELTPDRPAPAGSHAVTVTQSDEGGFFVMGQVNGVPVRFLVDTGATDIVLSPEDARRVGLDMGALSYDTPYETANGGGRGAKTTVRSLTVGPIRLANVPVAVNGAPLGVSLLGTPFLKRLDSFQIKGRVLLLKGPG